MALNIHLPENTVMRPKITVIGVGGAGGNATNNMIAEGLEGCDFVVANTDAQAIANSACEKRIQLGCDTTKGLGAGADPEVGRAAAEEALEQIKEYIGGSNMVFIAAGMGGGTGTGAGPVIAKVAKELGILTVGVVTKPFHFEGPRRMKLAEQGLEEMQKHVDTLIIIPNQNLFRIANEKTTFADAFKLADDVLSSGVRGITDLMVMPGLINLDFADVRAVMSEMGKAMMGTGEAEGADRAQSAAEAAISNPLLDNVSMKGAKGVLINITGGNDMTLFEVDEAANRIREEVEENANIIFGSTFNEALDGTIRVSVVATGIGLGEGAEYNPASVRVRQDVSPAKHIAAKPAPAAPATPKVESSVPPSESVAAAATTASVAPKPTNVVAPAKEPATEKPLELKPAAAPKVEKEAIAEKNYASKMAELNAEFEAKKNQEQPSKAPERNEPALKPAANEVENIFVSKPAVEPKEQQEDLFSPRNEAKPTEESQEGAGDGLFSKVFKAAKSLTPAKAESEVSVREADVSPKNNVSNDAGDNMGEEEDLVEIPAFLRRKS